MPLGLRFRRTLHHAQEIPRDKLDKCMLLLDICVRNQRTELLEEEINRLLDKACDYVERVAKEGGNNAEPLWNDAKGAVLELFPEMKGRVSDAERRDAAAAQNMVNATREMEKHRGHNVKIRLNFVTRNGDLELSYYQVKKRTPAANLASAVILARRERFPDLKEGLPHFYHPSTESTRKPADWDEKDTVPLELQVVMNTGWFRFTNVPLGNALLRNPIFRNIFMCQNTSAYLKDSTGVLYLAPALEHPVRYQKNQKLCDGSYLGWRKLLEHLPLGNEHFEIEAIPRLTADPPDSVLADPSTRITTPPPVNGGITLKVPVVVPDSSHVDNPANGATPLPGDGGGPREGTGAVPDPPCPSTSKAATPPGNAAKGLDAISNSPRVGRSTRDTIPPPVNGGVALKLPIVAPNSSCADKPTHNEGPIAVHNSSRAHTTANNAAPPPSLFTSKATPRRTRGAKLFNFFRGNGYA